MDPAAIAERNSRSLVVKFRDAAQLKLADVPLERKLPLLKNPIRNRLSDVCQQSTMSELRRRPDRFEEGLSQWRTPNAPRGATVDLEMCQQCVRNKHRLGRGLSLRCLLVG